MAPGRAPAHDLVDFGPVFWPELVPTLPDARLTVLPRAGHNAWIDQPAAYSAALVRALERIRAAQPP